MRIRLVHQLSALLIGAALLCVSIVSAISAWNLRDGFANYIGVHESEKLDRFAQLLTEEVVRAGSLQALLPAEPDMRRLMGKFIQREGLTQAPTLHQSPDFFAARVKIFDANRLQIAGLPSPISSHIIQRPILFSAREIGRVTLDRPQTTDSVDAQFLRRQYVGLGLATAASLLVTLVAAVWLARRWTQPLLQLRKASQRVAQGDFESTIPNISSTKEISDLSSDLISMAQALRTLESARRNWIAQISHELRTPLAILRGEIEAVQDGVRKPSVQHFESLNEEVLHLSTLVDDLHLLAMADLGRLPCEFKTIDPFSVLNHCVEHLVATYNSDDLLVSYRRPENIRLLANWDAHRVEQVIRNLLHNSYRHTARPGKVAVSWAYERSLSGIALTVENTAPAFDLADLTMIFDPTLRSTKYKVYDAKQAPLSANGSGLGLAIVKAIVQAHGGTVRALSSRFGGLAIEIVLPVLQE